MPRGTQVDPLVPRDLHGRSHTEDVDKTLQMAKFCIRSATNVNWAHPKGVSATFSIVKLRLQLANPLVPRGFGRHLAPSIMFLVHPTNDRNDLTYSDESSQSHATGESSLPASPQPRTTWPTSSRYDDHGLRDRAHSPFGGEAAPVPDEVLPIAHLSL